MNEEDSSKKPPQNGVSSDEAQTPNESAIPKNDSATKEAKIDYEALYFRAKADLENYRNQTAREKANFAKFACTNLIISILPVLDNFQRAAAHLPKDLADNEWVKGIAGIEKQFESVLGGAGLKKIKTKAGDICDANLHEAIAVGAGKEGEIIDVMEEGYELNGKVIRASKVRVGNGTTSENSKSATTDATSKKLN